MKKFVKLTLFSAMLLLLTVACGISSEDIDATVEARIATAEAKVEARIASMATPTPLPPTATPYVVFVTATPRVVIVTPTPTPTSTPPPTSTIPIPTPTPITNLTASEAVGLVEGYLQTKIVQTTTSGNYSSCLTWVPNGGQSGYQTKRLVRYDPAKRTWLIRYSYLNPIAKAYRYFDYTVYDRTMIVISQNDVC